MRTTGSGEEVTLSKEKFSMQRAFLFALTIREDVPAPVKILITKIERELSRLADVESHFQEEQTNV